MVSHHVSGPCSVLLCLLTFNLCSDYINPIDLCNRLNTYIVPEAAVHAFLTFLFLINGCWLAILLNLPLLAFNAKKCVALTHTYLPDGQKVLTEASQNH